VLLELSCFDTLQFGDQQNLARPFPMDSIKVASGLESLQGAGHDMDVENQGSGISRGTVVFDNNDAGYPFNQPPCNNDYNPYALCFFANTASSQLWYTQPPVTVYDGVQQPRPSFVSSPFTSALEPNTSFGNYATLQSFTHLQMSVPLSHYDLAPPSQQPMNGLFSASAFEPALQPFIQDPTAARTNQASWPAMQSNTDQISQVEMVYSTIPNQNIKYGANSSPVMDSELPIRTTNASSMRNPILPSETAAPIVPGLGRDNIASQNIYSNSDFDMSCILASITGRQNPVIDIGAVDMSSAFILCDVMSHDDPIVYVSDAFEGLTGYTRHEVLGRNCRFLQAPDGKVVPGIKREYVDNDTVYRLKEKIRDRSEIQISMINFRKGGQPFLNLLTLIPIPWGTADCRFYAGFYVDLVEQSETPTKRNTDGFNANHYKRDQLSRYVPRVPASRKIRTAKSDKISENEVPFVPKSIDLMVKACAKCGTRKTPEWRRGPNGNRDLCNRCGLRWAKQVGILFLLSSFGFFLLSILIGSLESPYTSTETYEQNESYSSSSSAKLLRGSIIE
jgi:PAS domain S-box-containing protein